MAEEAKAGGSGLTGIFKKAASFVFNKHTILHGALMLGMVFPMISAAVAAAGTTATFGDVALGAFNMFTSMFTGWVDGVGVLTDCFNNAVSGQWAAQGLEIASHGATHAASAADLATYGNAASAWGANAGQLAETMLNHN